MLREAESRNKACRHFTVMKVLGTRPGQCPLGGATIFDKPSSFRKKWSPQLGLASKKGQGTMSQEIDSSRTSAALGV